MNRYTEAQRLKRREKKKRYKVNRMTKYIIKKYEINQRAYKEDDDFRSKKKTLFFEKEWQAIRELCLNIIKKFKGVN